MPARISNPHYSKALRQRAHELYYVQDMKMSHVLNVLQSEFDEARRLNVDRLHSVARQHRLRLKLPAKRKDLSASAHARKAVKRTPNQLASTPKTAVVADSLVRNGLSLAIQGKNGQQIVKPIPKAKVAEVMLFLLNL